MHDRNRLALADHYLGKVRQQLLLGSPIPGDRFSLGAAIRGMASENIPGYERSVLQATAELAGENYDPQRVRVPWSVLGPRLFNV